MCHLSLVSHAFSIRRAVRLANPKSITISDANNFGAPSTPATLRSYIETVMHSSDDPNGTPYVFQKLEEGNPLVQDFRLGFVHPRLTHATAPELFLGAWHRGIADLFQRNLCC